VLGVGRDATQAEIEDAYRERVKETHPDLNDSPDASDAFKRVQDAEAVLSDPDERARYDRLGHVSYTRHFHEGRPGDEGDWSVGADPTPEEAGYDPGDVRDDKRSYTPGDDGTDRTDRGFGFDPGEYDTTSAYDGAGNPGERSYDVGGTAANESSGNGVGGAETGGPDAGGPGPDAAGASADAAGASADGRTHAEWRREAERVRDRWTKDAQRAGRGDESTADGGYAVHDWEDTDLSPEPTEYPMETSEFVVIAVLFVLYPMLAYSMIAPAFSLLVNVVVGICGIVLMGYLLTMPRVGFYVFGAWSVLAPFVVLTIPGIEVLSVVAVVIVAAAWIPFGYSVLFLRIVD
jgi:molecular chaperone DnaJ